MKRISILILMMVVGIINLRGQIDELHIDIEQPEWERIIAANEGPSLSRFAEANGRMWTIDASDKLIKLKQD